MTVGRTEEICVGSKKERSMGDLKKKPLTFTALSTIAVQSGQTQIVVSILKSGPSVHLQLVHVEPGLCEIGSDQEENQNLIYEQKQLLEKLKKHEGEVLSSVDKKRVEQRRQRKDDWICEQRSPQEDQEGVYRTMETSLREGWTLLLRLLDRRLHTLTLTADFYHTVKEFALGIERLEDLEIKPGRLNDAQLTYISIRRDLLGKSLQLLGISSDLMKKLRELQKTEALQRQGQVLQEEDEEDQESSQCSGGTVLRLERVVEMLQDRRRAVDQEVKLQIQQAQKNRDTKTSHSEQSVENQEWTLEEILAQDLSFASEEESDLELKLEKAGKSPEQPSAPSASTRSDDNTFTSNSSLESMSSNEVLNLQSAYELVEEQQLRVESRNENREPTPTYGYEETQETSDDEATLRKSLESLSQVKEELELEDFMNFEAEPETEMQNLRSEFAEIYTSSLNKDFKLDEQIQDVATAKKSDETLEVRSSSSCTKEQESGSKLERSLPIFNHASLQLHSELQGTNEIKLITDGSERPELKHKSDDFKSGVKSHLESKKDSMLQEFKVVDNENLREDHHDERSTDLDADRPPRLPNSKVVHNESGLNEMNNINFEIQTNTSKEGVPEIKQSSTENLLSRSDSNEGSPLRTKLAHRSRSLPIFNIVSKKLQPKLQETKDLLDINNDTEALLEEKTQVEPQEITHMQSEVNAQFNDHKTAENPNNEKSQNVKPENVSALNNDLDINSSMNIIEDVDIVSDQGTIDKSSEEPGYTVNTKSELTPMHEHDPQQDAPETKSESFSERFKKLQSKWQEKEDEPLVPKTAPYKVKNQKPVSNSKPKQHVQEVSILKDKWENKEIEVHVQHNTEDRTVMLSSFEDLSDEHLVHEIQDNPNIETMTKEEISTVEKYEHAFDHSTPKLKQEEDSKLHLEETEKLHKSYDQLAVKVREWLDHCTCELSVSSNPGHSLSEAQHVLNVNIQLQSEAETAEEDVVSLVQIVDHLQALCSDFSADTSVSSPQLTVQIDAIKKDLSTVKTTMQSNIQLQQAYISILQTAEEAKLDFERLKQVYSKKPEMEETEGERRWQAAQQKFLMMQELGNCFNSDRREVRETPGHLESMVHVVMETMEHLKQTQEEVEELRKRHLIQIQNLRDDKEFCLRYSERLKKTVKDLQCVSELLDSCTAIDLGSEQHTSRLRQQFTQARPHFTQLDTEANFVTSNFETLRRLQKRHGLRIAESVAEEDVSAVLDLHLKLKQKIEESEAILDLSGNFHLIIQQLETLLQNKPLNSSLGSCAEEKLNLLKKEKEQVHNQFNRASNLKMDICDGVKNSSVTGLRVQRLEACLQSVDSQRVSWLHETAEFEEKVLREMKTQALLHDIHLVRDTFKDLKKRFSNMKINYLKRNDRSRNIKAARNQLQQVDSYEDKLQSLKSRLQALTARLQSEVKDGGSTRELEDLLNELHRQMGECERSIREHRKTLDMTCSLQEAMDEYQMWCEEASGTIARVGKFSTECRSTEAVAVLYRQFEKFVWPTVPQQEERISQITELAVRLHGVDEGRRYIEKTLSKHSEMVTAIRALSDGLLELEGKLKKESEQVEMKEKQMEESGKEKVKRNSMNEMKDEDKLKVNEMKDEDKLKVKDQIDNRRAQEAAEMHELKETGHTPELSNKHDGKELPVRRHSFSKKPPLHKNRTQETDRQASSSFCSTHTFSMSCTPLETSRQVYAIISEPQAAVAQITPTHLPPSPREVHKAKREDTHSTPQETGAGSPYETELQHHHEVLSEDSLSTDEYECPSPDDISLPPLAETPESIMVQSDLEEGVCFGSQHSYRSHVQSEHRESSEINQHSVNRFRTESGTFVPSPLAMPIQTQVQAEFTTTVHMITTEATIITPEQTNVQDSIPDQPSRNTQLIPSVPTLKDKKPSLNVSFPASSNFSEELPHLRQDDSLLKSFPVCRSSIHQQITSFEMKNVSSKANTSENCEKSQLHQVLNDVVADIKLTENEVPTPSNNDTTTILQRNQLHNDFSNALQHNSTSPKSVTGKVKDQSTELSGSSKQKETVLCQEESLKCGQSSSTTKVEEAKNVSTITPCNNRTTTIIKETVYSQSSISSRSVIQAFSNPVLNKDDKDDTAGISDQDLSTEDNILRKPNKDTEDEMARHDKEFKNTLGSNSFEDNVTNPQEVLRGSSAKEPDSIDHLSPPCNATSSATNINIKQNHQTVYHETSTEQCVHDPGFCSHPCPTPLSEAQTQALAQQANTHVTPPYTSPHLLTPDQDPDICQPCTIREEIRLTPQIKGPSIHPHDQKECSCFTRPVSKAAVVGGSPVTLEVEVTGQPEPMLTWCKDDTEEEEQVQVENQRYEEAKAMDGAVCEAWLSAVGTKENKSSNDEGEDRGLMAEMYDIIMGDWQTWFGTLCFLLWLLLLIVI